MSETQDKSTESAAVNALRKRLRDLDWLIEYGEKDISEGKQFLDDKREVVAEYTSQRADILAALEILTGVKGVAS